MKTIQQFIDRNKDTYIKHALADKNLIEKYRNMYQGNSYFPEELLWIWEKMGFGIYENGFLQMVNPDEYEFIFEYVDKLLEPTIVWGITALGDLLVWEGNENWTIAPDEGDRCSIINVRRCNDNVIGDMEGTLNVFIADDGDDFFLREKDMFDAKIYLDNKDKLPKLNYGECYGYVPALALGGSKSIRNLKVVDAKAYIHLIGQAVGKIIDYGE
ncbi:T6SS immunity protein Tdi1 domain-containing protein [Gallibacterium anatis]|uniref:T6SS immunity protein Tdi1 domain-containing protein n=1 Tax=Gallibacterium anatis TaxID=750 RepID=UPI0039FDAC17